MYLASSRCLVPTHPRSGPAVRVGTCLCTVVASTPVVAMSTASGSAFRLDRCYCVMLATGCPLWTSFRT